MECKSHIYLLSLVKQVAMLAFNFGRILKKIKLYHLHVFFPKNKFPPIKKISKL